MMDRVPIAAYGDDIANKEISECRAEENPANESERLEAVDEVGRC
jgi:hypothetical protein